MVLTLFNVATVNYFVSRMSICKSVLFPTLANGATRVKARHLPGHAVP